MGNVCSIGCEYADGCPNGICRSNNNEIDDCDLYLSNERNTADDPQTLRHLVFLILLLCSMFIVSKPRNFPFALCALIICKDVTMLRINQYYATQGLSISIGTLIMEQLTGVYAELAFLDVALNFGQSIIAFGIFGLDPSLGRLGCWLRKICRKWHIGKIIPYFYICNLVSTGFYHTASMV